MRFIKRPFSILIAASLIVANAGAFEVVIHRAITHLSATRVTAIIGGETRTFSERAVQQLEDANEHVDDLGTAAYRRPDLHFTDEGLNTSSNLIIQNKKAIIANLISELPDGDAARKLLGETLHTIQDFYSHSNWVEQGTGGINTSLGRNVLADPPVALMACPADMNTVAAGGGGGTTSAYYREITDCTIPAAGKCSHGTWNKSIAGIPIYTAACIGINKDLDAGLATANGVPVNPLHGQARALAESATQDFIQQIVDELEGNDAALSALFDVKGSIGFVVDTTGSMGSVINGVKAIANGLVSVINLIPSLRPDRWIVEPFNDPGIGPITVSTDVRTISAAIDGLFADGGGDCPELSQGGINEALDKVTANSNLFIFTDASAKDGGLQNQVISKAQYKKTRLTYLLNGSCSPIDTAYIRGAAETGGQVFQVGAGEIPQLQTLIQAKLSSGLASISSIQGVIPDGATQRVDIPIDTSAQSIAVSASLAPGMRIALKTPNGTNVDATYPGARIITLSGGAFITLDRPISGNWQIELVGSGNYSVEVSGNSLLALNTFDIVVPNRDLHGGFNSIEGSPAPGSNVTAIAKMVGSFRTVNFDLIDEAGTVIKNVTMLNDPLQVGPGQFIGNFTVPAGPFRVRARGSNIDGAAYQREVPTVFRAQPLSISVVGGASTTIVAGAPASIPFVVTNLGAAGTFSIQATDTARFVTSAAPTVLTLSTGSSAPVQVNLLAPASTPTTDSASTVTLVVTNMADQTQFNRATVSVDVVNSLIPGDLNGDGFVNCSDISIVRRAFGQTSSQLNFDARADINSDKVIDIRDMAFVSQRLPVGLTCN